MVFDVKDIQKQLTAAPIVSPYPHDLAMAIVCDTFRLAGLRPPSRADWEDLERRAKQGALFREQVVMLAYALTSSSLRADTVASLRKNVDTPRLLRGFFLEVEPLTAEMIRSNAFRQEEFLRKWVHAVDGQVKDESPKESAARRNQLDYRTALREMERAEQARKKEADRRAKELQEAAQRATDARGWRE
ncbi:hypothetical protein VZQ01_17860 [Myxococcus faecalis]|uniref:hypothetical protein n=1 Tax=Myxococcus TaxID=32 RepID=UPI0020C0BA08|nr:hypothetical protein [Myxococcus fulvus]MCK8501388.1 hypothetical protein [Myxococcus fulvus]